MVSKTPNLNKMFSLRPVKTKAVQPQKVKSPVSIRMILLELEKSVREVKSKAGIIRMIQVKVQARDCHHESGPELVRGARSGK